MRSSQKAPQTYATHKNSHIDAKENQPQPAPESSPDQLNAQNRPQRLQIA